VTAVIGGATSPEDTDAGASQVRVTRSSHSTVPLALLGVVVVAGLALAGPVLPQADSSVFVNFFILLAMASMWNLLAGYAGMVSIGQQAFIGLGAYGVLVLADSGFNPFAAVPLAALVCGVLALPISLLVFRLRGGYFSIATWVVADASMLVISSISSLGGGTGKLVPGLSGLGPKSFEHDVYWISLAVVVLALATAYLLLRSRLGLVLTALRDDEVGARAAGVRVASARRVVYVVAAIGCAAGGALLAVSQLDVQPSSVFSVQWSAEIIFVTMIGGIGTIEGPILGTLIFFVLQQNLASDGAWYLIIFGALAVIIAIWAPKGLWGTATRRLRVQIFPVGYYVGTGAGGEQPEGSAPSTGY
jgi:branched-chain amino acid transport system permease protein